MDKTRVDKWLWAVRIFKSRSIANNACKSNKVKRHGEILKPSSLISVSDEITVRKNGIDYAFEVLKLIQKRVGYEIAKECYRDITPADELNKFNDWYIGKAPSEIREKGSGRPTKKERRVLQEFKNHPDSDPDIDESKSK